MTKTASPADALAELKQAEVARAEPWKERAQALADEIRAALEVVEAIRVRQHALIAEMEATPPETALGAQAVAEVKAVLLAGNPGALERLRERAAARRGVVVTPDGVSVA